MYLIVKWLTNKYHQSIFCCFLGAWGYKTQRSLVLSQLPRTTKDAMSPSHMKELPAPDGVPRELLWDSRVYDLLLQA